MGSWIKKVAPNCVHEVPLSSLSGQRIAVDTSIFLYQFICITNSGRGNYFDMFINMILWLLKNNIRPVFVFDGPPPPEKDRTKNERKAAKVKLENKVRELEDLLDILDNYTVNDLPEEIQKRINEILETNTETFPLKKIVNELSIKFKKYNSQCIYVTKEDTKKIQDLLKYMGLPYINSEYEAEKTCSWLTFHGYTKAVLTRDSDVLAYAAPFFLRNVSANKEMCEIICYQDLIDTVGLTKEEFIDFCIMCGTDYNYNIPKIGPSKAYSLIQEFGSIENVEKAGYDVSILFHNDARRLFTLPPDDPNFRIPVIEEMDVNNLDILLFKNNSRFTLKEIYYTRFQPKFKIIN